MCTFISLLLIQPDSVLRVLEIPAAVMRVFFCSNLQAEKFCKQYTILLGLKQGFLAAELSFKAPVRDEFLSPKNGKFLDRYTFNYWKHGKS